jgi:pSer/pThr/pTyr-binding forkhead associated (FHA) protein
MAKLILSMDGLVLKEIPLTRERTSVGRKPHNDIQIDNLAISGEHAVIVTILNDSFLEDLNSTNGTYVNGQPVKKHFLQNNDVIELGKYRLKFLTEPATLAPAEYEKTLILRPETLRQPGAETAAPAADAKESQTDAKSPATPKAPAAAPAASPASAPAAEEGTKPVPAGVIKILNGVNAGRELSLSKTLTTLGKPGVQVAVITRRPQGYYLTHVEGARLPTVNGQPLGTQAHPLQDHDVIEVAGVRMEFFLRG